MSQQPIAFQSRPLVPLAHDYPHGASEPWHHRKVFAPVTRLTGIFTKAHTAGEVLRPAPGCQIGGWRL